MHYDASHAYDAADPVAGTIRNALAAHIADMIGDGVQVGPVRVIETGGGCSAAVVDVTYRNGSVRGILGQLVMWDGAEGDSAPVNPYHATAAAWYSAGALYDTPGGADDDDDTYPGSAEPWHTWTGDNAAETIDAMVWGALGCHPVGAVVGWAVSGTLAGTVTR